MQARIVTSRDRPAPTNDPFWLGIEPEDLEDLARRLCASRPGSRVAERLMERAAYLRAMRTGAQDGTEPQNALLFA